MYLLPLYHILHEDKNRLCEKNKMLQYVCVSCLCGICLLVGSFKKKREKKRLMGKAPGTLQKSTRHLFSIFLSSNVKSHFKITITKEPQNQLLPTKWTMGTFKFELFERPEY